MPRKQFLNFAIEGTVYFFSFIISSSGFLVDMPLPNRTIFFIVIPLFSDFLTYILYTKFVKKSNFERTFFARTPLVHGTGLIIF